MGGWDCMRDEATGECLEGVGGQLIAANLVEVVSICAWVSILSCLIFLPLRLLGMLKASDDDQDLGMDAKHSPQPAYDLGSRALSQFVNAGNSKKKQQTLQESCHPMCELDPLTRMIAEFIVLPCSLRVREIVWQFLGQSRGTNSSTSPICLKVMALQPDLW